MIANVSLCRVNNVKFTLYGKEALEDRAKEIADMLIGKIGIVGVVKLEITSLIMISMDNFNIYDSSIIESVWEHASSLDEFVENMKGDEIVCEIRNKREIYKLI